MTKQTFGTGWLLWLIGVTIQQGDCAIIEPLKYETGWFYSSHKEAIDFEVQTAKGSPTERTPSLERLAQVYNCTPNGYILFKQKILKNKKEIFGDDFRKSGRQVMLSINNLVEVDKALHKLCPI